MVVEQRRTQGGREPLEQQIVREERIRACRRVPVERLIVDRHKGIEPESVARRPPAGHLRFDRVFAVRLDDPVTARRCFLDQSGLETQRRAEQSPTEAGIRDERACGWAWQVDLQYRMAARTQRR